HRDTAPARRWLQRPRARAGSPPAYACLALPLRSATAFAKSSRSAVPRADATRRILPAMRRRDLSRIASIAPGGMRKPVTARNRTRKDRRREFEMLRFAFLAAAAVLWSSVFGYVAFLVATAGRRRSLHSHRASLSSEPGAAAYAGAALPEIAVVIPVRNEQRFIAGKLANLRNADYPAERLAIIVVDGGSSDDTAALVEAARDSGDPVTLVRVSDARGRADQLNAVLSGLSQQIVVVTDADAELDPGCLRA